MISPDIWKITTVIGVLSATASYGETATPMSKAEMLEELVGSTIPLGAGSLERATGAIYFVDSNSAELLWDGKREVGTWTAGARGQLCYSFRAFGGKECVGLYKIGQDGGHLWIWQDQQRRLPPGAIVSGKAF